MLAAWSGDIWGACTRPQDINIFVILVQSKPSLGRPQPHTYWKGKEETNT